METILTIISSLLGCSTLVGFILYGNANRRIKDAEAEKSEAEANEVEDHRFDNLLKLVDSLTTRLSTLNATIDKHIDRNRELADRLYAMRITTACGSANGLIAATRVADALPTTNCRA